MAAPLLFCACIVSSPWLILMTPRVDDSWETEIGKLLCCGPLYDSATSQVGSDGNADEAFSPSRLLWTSGSRFYIRPGFLLVRFVYLDAVLLFRFRTPPFDFRLLLLLLVFTLLLVSEAGIREDRQHPASSIPVFYWWWPIAASIRIGFDHARWTRDRPLLHRPAD